MLVFLLVVFGHVLALNISAEREPAKSKLRVLGSDTVNVELETVLDFRGRDLSGDIEILDKVDKHVHKIRKILGESHSRTFDSRRKNNEKPDMKFSDFLQKACKILRTYKNEDLINIATIFTKAFKKNHYKELTKNITVRRRMGEKLDEIELMHPQMIKRRLNDLFMYLKLNEIEEDPQSFINYINSLYGGKSVPKFRAILHHLEKFKDVYKRMNVNMGKLCRNAIRSLVFDHYSTLSAESRRRLKLKIEQYWLDSKHDRNLKRNDVKRDGQLTTKEEHETDDKDDTDYGKSNSDEGNDKIRNPNESNDEDDFTERSRQYELTNEYGMTFPERFQQTITTERKPLMFWEELESSEIRSRELNLKEAEREDRKTTTKATIKRLTGSNVRRITKEEPKMRAHEKSREKTLMREYYSSSHSNSREDRYSQSDEGLAIPSLEDTGARRLNLKPSRHTTTPKAVDDILIRIDNLEKEMANVKYKIDDVKVMKDNTTTKECSGSTRLYKSYDLARKFGGLRYWKRTSRNPINFTIITPESHQLSTQKTTKITTETTTTESRTTETTTTEPTTKPTTVETTTTESAATKSSTTETKTESMTTETTKPTMTESKTFQTKQLPSKTYPNYPSLRNLNSKEEQHPVEREPIIDTFGIKLSTVNDSTVFPVSQITKVQSTNGVSSGLWIQNSNDELSIGLRQYSQNDRLKVTKAGSKVDKRVNHNEMEILKKPSSDEIIQNRLHNHDGFRRLMKGNKQTVSRETLRWKQKSYLEHDKIDHPLESLELDQMHYSNPQALDGVQPTIAAKVVHDIKPHNFADDPIKPKITSGKSKLDNFIHSMHDTDGMPRHDDLHNMPNIKSILNDHRRIGRVDAEESTYRAGDKSEMDDDLKLFDTTANIDYLTLSTFGHSKEKEMLRHIVDLSV